MFFSVQGPCCLSRLHPLHHCRLEPGFHCCPSETLWFQRFTLSIITDSKDDIFTPSLHLKKPWLPLAAGACGNYWCFPMKNCNKFASTFSKLSQTSGANKSTDRSDSIRRPPRRHNTPRLIRFCSSTPMKSHYQTTTPPVFCSFHSKLPATAARTICVTKSVCELKKTKKQVEVYIPHGPSPSFLIKIAFCI